MFLALGSIAPPTDTTSSPFFIRDTLDTAVLPHNLGANYNVLLVLEVVSHVRVRLHGECEEVEAGEVRVEDGACAIPAVVGVRSLVANKNLFMRPKDYHVRLTVFSKYILVFPVLEMPEALMALKPTMSGQNNLLPIFS